MTMVKTEYEEIARLTTTLPSAYQIPLVEKLAAFFGSRDRKFDEEKFYKIAALWKCGDCGVVMTRRLRSVVQHIDENHPREKVGI